MTTAEQKLEEITDRIEVKHPIDHTPLKLILKRRNEEYRGELLQALTELDIATEKVIKLQSK